MLRRTACALALVAPLTSCGASDSPADASANDAAPPALDANAVSDAAIDGAASPDASSGGSDAGFFDASQPTGCGTTQAETDGTPSTEGLVVSRDGALYFSVSGGVARAVPGGTPELSWARIRAGATVWGLVLDEENAKLYAVSRTTGSVHQIDTATGSVEVLADELGQPNGLTLGPDGLLYASDFSGNRVVRINVTSGEVTAVTTSAVMGANGVAFTDTATLLVASYRSGVLYELTLDSNGRETARTPLATGLGAPDGVAVLSDGAVLVTNQADGALMLVRRDGEDPETLLENLSAPANLEFGIGALRCDDLYIATGDGIVRYRASDLRQRQVPWH